MASIKIKATDDGTYTLYRNGEPVSVGLTRLQAERLASVMRWVDPSL